MKRYIDIKMKDDDFKIMGMVYSRLHFTLHDMSTNKIGVSFPNATAKCIGTTIRLQSEDESALNAFYGSGFVELASRYCDITPILDIPDNVKYGLVKPFRNKKSHCHVKRLIRRGANPDELRVQYGTKPHLRVFSASQQRYSTREFNIEEVDGDYVSGDFNSFGLSKGGMVALF